ncbi:N-acetyltransferase family protein [Gillisia sp. M10.2A]|uniref:N-acetyltransferase family protein n=1 Tax=Gillisia lutea TaxID=2909668 RepID=A0ABS9EG95_9FLAO|nr:GNAT family N-acetyltransferase [Gillisia lutea]MCF4101915.1 N-acetyltransferase family protein [Gillisia lutea]
MIRQMTSRDIPRVLEIYKMGLDTRNATFETIAPSIGDWDSKYLKHSRIVCEKEGKIVGWAALAPVSARAVYKGVAELSIYVDTRFTGKGIGSLLMEEVINSSESHGVWTLHSSIFPENITTLKLHEKFNFRIIGVRRKIAKLDDVWRDTVLLERRSETVGV